MFPSLLPGVRSLASPGVLPPPEECSACRAGPAGAPPGPDLQELAPRCAPFGRHSSPPRRRRFPAVAGVCCSPGRQRVVDRWRLSGRRAACFLLWGSLAALRPGGHGCVWPGGDRAGQLRAVSARGPFCRRWHPAGRPPWVAVAPPRPECLPVLALRARLGPFFCAVPLVHLLTFWRLACRRAGHRT